MGVGSDDNGEWHRSSVRLPIGATSTEDVCDTAFDQRFVNEFAARESRQAQMFFLFLIPVLYQRARAARERREERLVKP